MNIYTKIELLKYVKHFIIKHKYKIAKTFLNQIIKETTSKKELTMFNEMIECIDKNSSVYETLVIDRIDEIIKDEKNYPITVNMDNSDKMILG